MKRPEILSPAGNFEKMKAAILYGADAVYLAGNLFGMRAAADNFTVNELYAEDGEPIESAPHPFMKFWVRCPFDVREGDIMRSAQR